MDKFLTLADAVAGIPGGAALALVGFGCAHNYPAALIDALASSGRRDLCLVANSAASELEMVPRGDQILDGR
jgi:acyl CoA:acetate/3-ketoacid CoA transferase alpha subunit